MLTTEYEADQFIRTSIRILDPDFVIELSAKGQVDDFVDAMKRSRFKLPKIEGDGPKFIEMLLWTHYKGVGKVNDFNRWLNVATAIHFEKVKAAWKFVPKNIETVKFFRELSKTTGDRSPLIKKKRRSLE